MKYEDLSPEAQEKAREWWRRLESQDFDGTDCYDSMVEALKYLGIEVGQCTCRNGRGGTYLEYQFRWSGFYTQGSGLAFDGSWRAEDLDLNKLQAEWPQNEDLMAIAVQLQALALKWPQASARITTVSHGPDLPGLSLDDTETGTFMADGTPDWLDRDDYNALLGLMREAADWCYRYLEAEYESRMEDEYVAEAIIANEYEFDEDGSMGVGACV